MKHQKCWIEYENYEHGGRFESKFDNEEEVILELLDDVKGKALLKVRYDRMHS
ncbi:hypothetical protein [Pseudobutyrivibrio ruminis]|uniref:Uncharacterized protein n=1 Tax=Pseudobutyrivibrio ruminis DSM 9787 TaxID=1123011 RepID=A0A285RAB0_9FIRM|nr:hypothetical protein [Pseudobutyrivibrio ruminis]SOB91020.1 hypothetical protein SAMN02910411_0682 [Pseudobutyrivibrio ruminis DSM 9787]